MTSGPLQPPIVLGWVQVLLQDNQPKEGETLAFQLIAKEKTYGPIYDLLYGYYGQTKRLADVEKILKVRIDNNPSDAGSYLRLAAFYADTPKEADMQSTLQHMLSNPGAFPGLSSGGRVSTPK